MQGANQAIEPPPRKRPHTVARSQLWSQVAPQIGGYVNPAITGAGAFPYANVHYSSAIPATYSSAADVLGKK